MIIISISATKRPKIRTSLCQELYKQNEDGFFFSLQKNHTMSDEQLLTKQCYTCVNSKIGSMAFIGTHSQGSLEGTAHLNTAHYIATLR